MMAVQVYGCNHIVIEVTNAKKAVKFYSDVFGLKMLRGGEGAAWCKLGEHQFMASSRNGKMLLERTFLDEDERIGQFAFGSHHEKMRGQRSGIRTRARSVNGEWNRCLRRRCPMEHNFPEDGGLIIFLAQPTQRGKTSRARSRNFPDGSRVCRLERR